MNRFRALEPMRVLGAALALAFLPLLAGAVLVAANGGLDWQGMVSAAAAALIALLGLLYAWRLGAPGRRE